MVELKVNEYIPFEDIKQIDENGNEFWLARDIQEVLKYTQWRNFEKVVDKAKLACKNAGNPIAAHFADVSKTVGIGTATTKKIKDLKLTRYACYLIVQNGDPRKEVSALGQTYFAIQTRRAEVAGAFNELDESNKRLVVRGHIKQWNQLLVEAARKANVITNKEFAIFQNYGYAGLYGGLTVDDIHKRKELGQNEKILDFMGSTELIANLFRISQTEEKLSRERPTCSIDANDIHYVVGDNVRKAIIAMNATLPENSPTPNESIQKIERQEIAKIRNSKGPLMLDE